MAKFDYIQWLIDWINEVESFAFEWDNGNSSKSETKHGVTGDEAQSVQDLQTTKRR